MTWSNRAGTGSVTPLSTSSPFNLQQMHQLIPLQRLQLCPRLPQLGHLQRAQRRVKDVQLVDPAPKELCERVSHVCFGMDGRFPVRFRHSLSLSLSHISENNGSLFCRRIYVDTRLHTLLDLRFDKPFFKRGEFPQVVYNGSTPVALQDPWINGTNATPFDQGSYIQGKMLGWDKLTFVVRLLPDFERGCGRHEWVVPRWTGEQAVVEPCCQCVVLRSLRSLCADGDG